jgi:crossover junction endodeoxyribonuclease RusA
MTVRMGRGRFYRTREKKGFNAEVAWVVKQAKADLKLTSPISVEFDLYPPDNRRRDMDNVVKTLQDALTEAGVWVDDHQINHLTVRRHKARKTGGFVICQVRESAPA